MTKKDVLEKFTYDKTVKELKSEVEKARSEERIRELDWRREKDKQAKLKNQIEHCRIVTPVSGRLDYARWPVPGVDGQFATVEKGMTVRWADPLLDPPGRSGNGSITIASLHECSPYLTALFARVAHAGHFPLAGLRWLGGPDHGLVWVGRARRWRYRHLLTRPTTYNAQSNPPGGELATPVPLHCGQSTFLDITPARKNITN